MFGGLPATGAIARTATNIRSGTQSPVAGMIHALTLLCVLLFAAPLASYIPMAALAGILMVVSYNMGEWREILQLLRLTKTDISVWLVTFALTVFADLTVAVEAGMILAALLFIARVAETTTVSQVTGDYVEDGRLHILQDKEIPYYATIFRIHGPFLFGATNKISAVTEKLHELPPIVIIRLRNMTAIDATGIFALEEIAKQLHATKRTLILCGAREQPAQMIHQAEFEEVVGRENICGNVQEALRRAEAVFENIEANVGRASRSRRIVDEAVTIWGGQECPPRTITTVTPPRWRFLHRPRAWNESAAGVRNPHVHERWWHAARPVPARRLRYPKWRSSRASPQGIAGNQLLSVFPPYASLLGKSSGIISLGHPDIQSR